MRLYAAYLCHNKNRVDRLWSLRVVHVTADNEPLVIHHDGTALVPAREVCMVRIYDDTLLAKFQRFSLQDESEYI